MRLFLAIPVPDPIGGAIERAVAPLRARCRGWRWSRSTAFHLTVRFLGEVDADRDRLAREAWSRAALAVGPIPLSVGGIGVFPSASRARVLWIGVRETDSGARLVRLAREVDEAAARLGWPREARDFHPHLTIGRAVEGERPAVPAPTEIGDLGAFDASSLDLFRSELSSAGARHTRIAAYPFAGAAVG